MTWSNRLWGNDFSAILKKLLVLSEIPIVGFVALIVETKSTRKQLKNNIIAFKMLIVSS
jgi:hypothetical protein